MPPRDREPAGAPGPVGMETALTEQPTVAVLGMRPIQITVEGIGPFAPGHPAGVLLLGPHPPPDEADRDREPPTNDRFLRDQVWTPPDSYHRRRPLSDLIVVHADEGPGSSALLACIHGLFAALSATPSGVFAPGSPHRRPELEGRAQLDLHATCIIDGTPREIILSLWFGRDQPPVAWADLSADKKAWDADEWACIGFLDDGSLAPATNPLGRRIVAAIRAREGSPLPMPKAGGSQSIPTLAGLLALPSAIMFSHRPTGAVDGYHPAPILNPRSSLDLAAVVRSDSAARSELLERLRPFHHLRSPIEAGADLRSGEDFERDDWPSWGRRAMETLGLATVLRATRASLILVEDIDADLGPREIRQLPALLTEIQLSQPGSSMIVSVRTSEAMDDLRRAGRSYNLVTTAISMKAVKRR